MNPLAFPMLILNGIIWYLVFKTGKRDRFWIENGPYPENPRFDKDMDNLWQITKPLAPLKNDAYDETELRIKFEKLLERENSRDENLEEYLWKEGILNPEEVIWCNGTPLEACNPDDMKKFMEIKNRAYLEGIYNSIPLEDGGEHALHKDWLMMKGCSDYGAEKLLETGVKPWEFELD